MTDRAHLPPLPDIEALATGRPVLDQLLAELAGRPTTSRVAYYDDSPYVPPTEPAEAQR